MQTANDNGRRIYLLGEFASGAPWYYFPVAFAVKVPVAISALLGLAIAAPGQRPWRLGWLLGIPLTVYLVIVCIWLDIILGIRYVLPIFPLLFVFIATQLVPLGSGWRRISVGVLCAWLAIASLWIHPHYLAYFNEVAGGPSRGHRYLLDSNVDWGQDLTTLSEYLAERGNPLVWLAYFGVEKPAEYGLRSRRLKGCRPVTGLVAISTNVREGLYQPHGHMGITETGLLRLAEASRAGGTCRLLDLRLRDPGFMSCVQTRANRGVTLARQVVANEDDDGETDQRDHQRCARERSRQAEYRRVVEEQARREGVVLDSFCCLAHPVPAHGGLSAAGLAWVLEGLSESSVTMAVVIRLDGSWLVPGLSASQ